MPCLPFPEVRLARVKRRFRLTRSVDLKRVRNLGKSFAHPLVVLYMLPAEGSARRIAVSTSRAVGNAVQRNRAKRLLRAAMTELINQVTPGTDLLLVGRAPLAQSGLAATREALHQLLRRAGVFADNDER